MGTFAIRLPFRLATRFYLVVVEPVFTRIHLHSYVRQMYHWTLLAISEDRANHSVNGFEATFRTERVDEISYFADTVLNTASVHGALATEARVLNDFLERVNEDDVVLDIGAHYGLYTCLAQNRLSSAGMVIAIEPYPPNYDSLKANLSLNEGQGEAHRLALSDENGEVEFYEFDDRPGQTENALLPHFDGANETTVEARTGDSLLADRERPPTVIKIDVEGAELKVLNGLERTIRRPECRLIYCEVHPFSFSMHGGSHEAVGRLLADHGYETTVLDRKGELTYWLRAVRP